MTNLAQRGLINNRNDRTMDHDDSHERTSSPANGSPRRTPRTTSTRPTPTTWSASLPALSAADAERAIAAANAAFPAWSRSSIQQRHDILKAVGDEILARKDELGRLLSREEGKTLPEGVGEVDARRPNLPVLRRRMPAPGRRQVRFRAARRRRRDHARAGRRRRPDHAVEFPDRHSGLEDRAGARLRQLRGVQAGRTRAGSAHALSEIIIRAGVPAGVFNLVMGRGSVVGEAMLNSPSSSASPSPARSAPAARWPRPASRPIR